MKITSKGQVTVPVAIREQFGFLPYTEVEFIVVGNAVKLVKAKNGGSRMPSLISQLRGKATAGMSTKEIMKLTRG